MPAVTDTLQILEIYRSLQGEGLRAGRPCTLVRLAGCNLRCTWCDTPQAWSGGRSMPGADVLARVADLATPLVLVTGGEPLMQPAAPALLAALCDAGHETLLETNGSRDISVVDARVARVVDFKCPSSGHADANRWQNVAALTARDEVKFVVADRADFDWAVAAVREHGLLRRCPVTVQPAAGRCRPVELAGWLLACGLDLRLGLQLHKLLWPERTEGV